MPASMKRRSNGRSQANRIVAIDRGCAETQDLREHVVPALSGAFGSAAAALRATAVRD
jgi:hypothetical protein